jgi:phage gp46-like protein
MADQPLAAPPVWNADGVANVNFNWAVWNADGVTTVNFRDTPTWIVEAVSNVAFAGSAGRLVVGPKRIVPAPLPIGTYTPDIRLAQYTDFPTSFAIDWVLRSDGTIDDTRALATAVIVALGTNRLALASDILPEPDSTDRQGWWGDMDAEEIWNGWTIGCRLWLLKRSKIVGTGAYGGATVTLVEQYCREALQPFVDRKIATSFDVKAATVGPERIDARVRVFRDRALAVDLMYQILWDEITSQVTSSFAPQAIGQQSLIAYRR